MPLTNAPRPTFMAVSATSRAVVIVDSVSLRVFFLLVLLVLLVRLVLLVLVARLGVLQEVGLELGLVGVGQPGLQMHGVDVEPRRHGAGLDLVPAVLEIA